MTDTTTVAPPLTRRQAREIERRTGVRPVAVTASVAPLALATPAVTPAQSAALADDIRSRLAIATEATRARVRQEQAAPRTTVTTLPLRDELASDLSTTAELARDALVGVPAAFGGPETVRATSVRAAKPIALVRRQRRMRGAGLAFAASAAAFATVGAVAPGVGVLPDAAQASLVNADTVTDPAPASNPDVGVDAATGNEGGVSTANLVAAPDAAVDRGQYSVTTVSAEGLASVAPDAGMAPIEELITYADPYPTGRMNEGWGTRGGAHNGIDMVGGGCGADLIAVAAGTVTYVGFQGGYGNHVEIKLDEGDVISYSHLQSSSPLAVGQRVSPGDYIGPVGTTGNSTGCHLHFEVKVGGSFVNPVGWLEARGISISD